VSVPGPVLGPCTSWIDGADVAACCSSVPDFDDPAIFDAVALEASMALYEVSGRLFTGLCDPVTVRPCRDGCSCWGPSSLGLGPWYWSSAAWGAGGWGWGNECGDRLGCRPLSRIRLAGYPVREIVEVLVDGAVLPALDDNGNPNYRLDRWRFLVRMDDPGPPVQPRSWPACQNLALDETQPGTFAITYRSGVDPPELGRRAASELACQLYASCAAAKCVLPAGATKVTRQGVTVERGLLANWFDPTKPTGLVALDLFLKSYWRTRAARRPAVFSPDLQPFARRLGS
jgi:hypothetical protein